MTNASSIMPSRAGFAALADPTRLAIAERLMAEGRDDGGRVVTSPSTSARPAISRHLATLERAGLIERQVKKQWRVCRVRPDAMRSLDDWLQQHRAFWDGSLDRLARLFAEGMGKGGEQRMSVDAMLRVEREIPGPPEAVFNAWLEPEILKRWWGHPWLHHPRLPHRRDGRWRMGGDDGLARGQ